MLMQRYIKPGPWQSSTLAGYTWLIHEEMCAAIGLCWGPCYCKSPLCGLQEEAPFTITPKKSADHHAVYHSQLILLIDSQHTVLTMQRLQDSACLLVTCIQIPSSETDIQQRSISQLCHDRNLSHILGRVKQNKHAFNGCHNWMINNDYQQKGSALIWTMHLMQS